MNTSIVVQNLKCNGCANTIHSKLSHIQAISNINIDIENNKISFDFIAQEDILKVKKTLKTLGYPSIDETNSVVSKAKSFVSCASGKLS